MVALMAARLSAMSPIRASRAPPASGSRTPGSTSISISRRLWAAVAPAAETMLSPSRFVGRLGAATLPLPAFQRYTAQVRDRPWGGRA